MPAREYRVKIKGYRRVPVWADDATGQYGALSTAMGILEIDSHMYARKTRSLTKTAQDARLSKNHQS